MSILQAEEIMRMTVNVGPPYKVGRLNGGVLQVIPIIGGNVVGDRIKGIVVPGGADWNTYRDEGVAHVYAKYLLKTDDGEFIAIENEGLFESDTKSIIKTNPRFVANCEGQYQFLNEGVYVAELTSTPDTQGSVDIIIYRMN